MSTKNNDKSLTKITPKTTKSFWGKTVDTLKNIGTAILRPIDTIKNLFSDNKHQEEAVAGEEEDNVESEVDNENNDDIDKKGNEDNNIIVTRNSSQTAIIEALKTLDITSNYIINVDGSVDILTDVYLSMLSFIGLKRIICR